MEKVAIIDETGELFATFEAQMKTINEELVVQEFSGSQADAEADVENGEYEGLLILNVDDDGLPVATYKSLSVSDYATPGDLQFALQGIKSQLAAVKLQLTPDQLAKLNAPVAFDRVALKENAKTQEELSEARGLVLNVLLFVIYFAVIMYANMIAMEVGETEKSSCVMEILISSVSPIKQMFGKILGIALLSLTQMAFLLGVGYYFVKRNLEEMQGGFFPVFRISKCPSFNGYLCHCILYSWILPMMQRLLHFLAHLFRELKMSIK